jgi:hypothetical protein
MTSDGRCVMVMVGEAGFSKTKVRRAEVRLAAAWSFTRLSSRHPWAELPQRDNFGNWGRQEFPLSTLCWNSNWDTTRIAARFRTEVKPVHAAGSYGAGDAPARPRQPRQQAPTSTADRLIARTFGEWTGRTAAFRVAACKSYEIAAPEIGGAAGGAVAPIEDRAH